MSDVPTSRLAAVLFDYGGVLTTPVRDSIDAWVAADAIVPDSFSRTLKAWLGRDAEAGTPIHRLETGELADAEFETLLAAELTTHDGGPVVAEGMLGRLFAGLRADEAMFGLAADLKAAGLKLGLVSNSWGDNYPHERLTSLFDTIVISAEVGLRKPDPAIFRKALDPLGVAPQEAALVDDAAPNIEGAEALGLVGVLHVDAASTRARLAELVPGLVA